MSNVLEVVHGITKHKPSSKELVAVKKQPEVKMCCIGERKLPSKEAVDRFISIYLEIVKDNQKRMQLSN